MGKLVSIVLLLGLTVVVVSGLMSIPVYFLWNWLMPELFGFARVTFLQAIGLCWLVSFLFAGTSSSGKTE